MSKNQTKQYNNSKIYCIRNHTSDDIYIGSTTQTLCQRMAEHRSRVKNNIKPHYLLYQKMKELGVENFYIELVEECPCDNLEQLRKKEGEYIRTMGTLNRIISGRTDKEYQIDNKEKIKTNKQVYHQNNKDKLNKRSNDYYYDNKDDLLQARAEVIECECGVGFTKQHKLRHLDSAFHKQYLETGEKYRPKGEQCECGGFYTRANKAVHSKTQQHQAYLNQQNEN